MSERYLLCTGYLRRDQDAGELFRYNVFPAMTQEDTTISISDRGPWKLEPPTTAGICVSWRNKGKKKKMKAKMSSLLN